MTMTRNGGQTLSTLIIYDDGVYYYYDFFLHGRDRVAGCIIIAKGSLN